MVLRVWDLMLFSFQPFWSSLGRSLIFSLLVMSVAPPHVVGVSSFCIMGFFCASCELVWGFVIGFDRFAVPGLC